MNSVSAGRFLREYWQKQPLFIPAALANVRPALTADELAWLATLPDVESRLVFTERDGEQTTYRLEHGPFAASELESLPTADWTLLVQDVDKHLPAFRTFLTYAEFIPDWRIDDLMISFAAPGGSVGPHRDHYDVFLCQGEGQREWSIGDPQLAEPGDATAALSLLKPFAATETQVANEGDVLYLPPGVPHWGVATEPCMTYSIGMRAPTKAELLAGAARVIALDDQETDAIAESAAGIFYADPDLEPGEAHCGQISMSALERLRKQELLDASFSDEQLARVLGSVVTDPKAWLAPELLSVEEAENWLANPRDIAVHGMSRIAWCEPRGLALAFANGAACEMHADEAALMQELCINRLARAEQIEALLTRENGREFLTWLITQGVFDADPDRR